MIFFSQLVRTETKRENPAQQKKKKSNAYKDTRETLHQRFPTDLEK